MKHRAGMTVEPRKLVATPKAFGWNSEMLPPPLGIDPRGHDYRAAILQHYLARRVREWLKSNSLSVTTFAPTVAHVPGMSADRLRRMLRGETAATFADFTFWVEKNPQIASSVKGLLEAWATEDQAFEAQQYLRHS